MSKLIILGAGGHGKVCAEIAEQQGFDVFFLDDKFPDVTLLEHWPIIGKCNDYGKYLDSNSFFFIAVGDNKVRQRLYTQVKEHSGKFTTLVHNKAIISQYAEVAEASLVTANAVLNPFSKVSVACIINTAAVIEHDAIIEAFVHVSPNATVLGGAKIESLAWVGANSTVFPMITLGFTSILGAGSLLNKNAPSNSVLVGAPAKNITRT